MQDKKISIIIPIYNTEKFLEQCLCSVTNQTYKNLEILCINDGSTDNSQSIVENYQKSDSRILLFTIPNSGVSNARNVGLFHATGDYVMFVDSDDWIDSNMCRDMIEKTITDNADTVMCSYVKEYENKSINAYCLLPCEANDADISYIRKRLIGLSNKELKHPEMQDSIVSPCMQLFDAKKAKSISFPNIDNIGSFEDGLFQIDYYNTASSFSYVDKFLYHYRKDNSSSITTKYREKLNNQWLELYKQILFKMNKYDYDDSASERFNNRICVGIIGLCFNELSSKQSKKIIKQNIKSILEQELYESAFKKLKTSNMPFKWRIYFFFAKQKMVGPLLFLSSLAKKMKSR